MHNRTIQRLAAAAATAALVVTFNAAAAGAAIPDTREARQFTEPLTDLQPGVDDPLDGATARLIMTEHAGSTTFVLIVTGIDPAAAGKRTALTCTSARASPATGPPLARTTTRPASRRRS